MSVVGSGDQFRFSVVIMMFVFAACSQVPTVQRGHAHQERPAWAEICAVPLQLSPDLQEQQPEDRLPQVTILHIMG